MASTIPVCPSRSKSSRTDLRCFYLIERISGKSFGKLTTRTPQPGFDGVFWHAQHLRRLVSGTFPHNTQDKHRPEHRGKFLDLLFAFLQDFQPSKKLLWRWTLGCQPFRHRDFILAL